MVSLQSRTEDEADHICGATIVDQNAAFVVTAAHCVQYFHYSNLQVRSMEHTYKTV